MRHSRTTIEFLGIWEQLNNPVFKGGGFDSLLFEAGSNSFTLSPVKWKELTHAKGIKKTLRKKLKMIVEFAHFIQV